MGPTPNNVTDSTFTDGKYGVQLYNAQSNNFLNVSVPKNTYGLYLTMASIGNNFYRISSLNSTVVDVYSDENLSGSQTEFVSSMGCGTTNAHWAPCRYVTGNLGYTPILILQHPSAPGTYAMESDIIGARDDCITITSNDVTLNCAGGAYSPTGLETATAMA